MSSANEDVGCLLVVLAVLAGIWFAMWGRNTSLRYEWEHDVGAKDVTIGKEPTDCDFLTAPLGIKNCVYEKEVTVVTFKSDNATGRPVASSDGGKTWVWNDGGAIEGKHVYVWWRKKSD
jgi:hypothetical protein